jgi:hypothetical protein
VEAGRLLGIEVLDHLIVGRDDIVSLRAAGLITDWETVRRPRRIAAGEERA